MWTKLMLLYLLQLVVWPYVSAVNWQLTKPYIETYDVFKELNQLENRIKRATTERKLPTDPILFKFEISDAVEPSAEVKALLSEQRQDRKIVNTSQAAVAPKSNRKRNNTARNSTSRKTKRNRRSTNNFKAFNHESVKLIPFLVSEAREPDEATKVMIKRMRSIELENLENLAAQKANKQQQIKRLRRRSRRSAPKFIPFELADAKFSFNELKTARNNRQFKSSDANSTAKRDLSKNSTVVDDQQTHDTKIHYIYKEAPFKFRKSYDALPSEVQTVVELLNNNVKIGKPHVMHMNLENLDYNALRPSIYNIKYASNTKFPPVAYVKYLRLKKKPIPVTATEPPAMLKAPIIVSQANELSPNYAYEQLADNKFRPSKPDTYMTNENMEYSSKIPEYNENIIFHKYAKPMQDNNHVYQLKYQSLKQQEPNPMIKVEYHVPANVLKGDYKDYDEFKSLSALIGKSTQDQMHGLAYLLAKEMQNKLYAQQQPNLAAIHARPQDNTSPVLFHPDEKPSAEDHNDSDVENSATDKLIGMAKGKTYIPIVENNAESAETKTTESVNLQLKSKAAFQLNPKKYNFAIYETKSNLLTKEPEAIVANEPLNLESSNKHKQSYKTESIKYGINHDDAQYASKYTFGYRIRDFHTGNDFGHKQNRDLHGVTRGQYHILLPDGRIQNVIYHADASGFHADVSFETGTK